MFKSLEEGIALAQVLAPMHGVSHTVDFFIPGDTEASGGCGSGALICMPMLSYHFQQWGMVRGV